MANSSTQVDTIPVQVGGFQALNEYEIVIDTLNTDLAIQTALSTNRVWVVGIMLSESNALNLTFKSVNTTTNVVSKQKTYELASNQGLTGFIDNGFYFVTNLGEQLVIQSNAAIGATPGKNLTLYCGSSHAFRRV